MPLLPENAPYFDATKLPKPKDAYVAWLDVMGVQATMMRSLHTASNFIFKLHVAALEQKKPKMKLYPVMDGVYVVTPDKSEMREFLKEVFTRLAIAFNNAQSNEFRFLAKASVAFGPVIHGENVNKSSSDVFADNISYKDSILLGIPMILANQGEKNAPSFGVSLHYSALSLAEPEERKWSYNWWPWFELGKCELARKLKEHLKTYFDWCEERAGVINYDPARIKAHSSQANQYLVGA